MKTVLHLMEQLTEFGGGPRVLMNLASHPDSNRNKLIYFTYQPSDLLEEVEKRGVEVISLSTLSIFRIVAKLIQVIRRKNVDVIITHHTRPLLIGWIAAKVTGIPLIHHEHSSAGYHNRRRKLIERICLPFAGVIVCCSSYAARSIQLAYRVRPEQIRVLYNPVEERKIHRGGRQLREEFGVSTGECVIIGHIGGMIEGRDQMTLIRAFYRLQRQVTNLRLLLIGDGPLRSKLQALVDELNLGNHVIFTGYTEHVGDCLDAMDIYVNPAVDEGFGIAVVEAMLAKLPVVLAKSGSHPELINDGEGGYFFDCGDVESLFRILEKLCRSRELRQTIAAEAEKSARKQFTTARFAEGYMKLVEDLSPGVMERRKNLVKSNH